MRRNKREEIFLLIFKLLKKHCVKYSNISVLDIKKHNRPKLFLYEKNEAFECAIKDAR